jgi:hypothetical protein
MRQNSSLEFDLDHQGHHGRGMGLTLIRKQSLLNVGGYDWKRKNSLPHGVVPEANGIVTGTYMTHSIPSEGLFPGTGRLHPAAT